MERSDEAGWLFYSNCNSCMALCSLAAASSNPISCQDNWQQMALSNCAMKFIYTKKMEYCTCS